MQYNCELASVNALINGGGRIMASSAEIVTCDQIFAILTKFIRNLLPFIMVRISIAIGTGLTLMGLFSSINLLRVLELVI